MIAEMTAAEQEDEAYALSRYLLGDDFPDPFQNDCWLPFSSEPMFINRWADVEMGTGNDGESVSEEHGSSSLLWQEEESTQTSGLSDDQNSVQSNQACSGTTLSTSDEQDRPVTRN